MKSYAQLWYLTQLFLEWGMFRKNLGENSKYTVYVRWLFSENRAVCEIMQNNTVEPDRPQITL